MPTIYDSKLELLNFSDLVNYTIDQSPYVYDGIVQQVNAELRAYPSLSPNEAWEQACVRILETNGLNVERNAAGGWTASVFPNVKQVTDVAPLNSNSTVIKRGSFREMYGNIKQFDGAHQYMQVTRYPASGGLGTKAMYLLGSIGSAVSAVSTGIWLGKTFDSALYNLMPDFWDSIGASSLNPETWGSLTNGSDSPFAGLLNFILGIDGEHGTAQAYIDQNQLAYMALLLKNAGLFDSADKIVSNYPSDISGARYLNDIVPFYVGNGFVSAYDYNNYHTHHEYIVSYDCDVVIFRDSATSSSGVIIYVSPVSTIITKTTIHNIYDLNTGELKSSTTTTDNYEVGTAYTYDGKTVYSGTTTGNAFNLGGNYSNKTLSGPINIGNINTSRVGNGLAWLALYNSNGGTTVPGVGNQTGATLPDVSTWNDIPSTLQSLQNQYPDAFQNPMVWNSDTPYDDTAGNQTTYIPVPFPIANSSTDTMPISGTQTQTNTQVGLSPEQIQDLLSKTVQQTSTEPAIPPSNPTDTGTGSTLTPTAPTGNASALWSVYHPTQAQINSFGAWLWGSPFLTDIGKLFQNPIDGVISLHKIFATPVDSGTGTIVVGTLNSNVASATVNQQYIEVDCGSVNCFEDFGNVFDYEPYTKVSLYLPFIGIVPLNVSDVMRSTISITYGVDVFTGACIAMVEVSRDGGTINMYQYTGNCAVHYPLSNVQQSQLISGLLGIAAGVGSVLATGGVSAPAVLGMAGGALAAGHTSIGRSGGFSANAGAMGIKVPYLIIERPQTKVAETFPDMDGYPTNYSIKLGSCSNHVVCKTVHVYGINATESELTQIEQILKDGVEV